MSDVSPFSALAADGTPRVFVGMHRPPLVIKGYISCSCGMMLTTMDASREHWQMGHFDSPLYQDAPA